MQVPAITARTDAADMGRALITAAVMTMKAAPSSAEAGENERFLTAG